MQHSDDQKDCMDIMKEKMKDAAKATKEVAEHAKKKLTGNDEAFHLKKNVHKDAAKRAQEQHEYMQQFEKPQSKRESKDSASINEEGEGEEEKLFYYKDSRDAKQRKRRQPAIRQRNSQRLLNKAGSSEAIVVPPPAKLTKRNSQKAGVNNEGFHDALA